MAEDKDRIRLHDLIMQESSRVAASLFGGAETGRSAPSLKEYERHLETLLPLMAAGGYWGKPIHRRVWLRCFQQMVTPKSGPFPNLVLPLDFYPAYLLLYAYGIASLAGGRPSNLAYVLANATAKNAQKLDEPIALRFTSELRDNQLENAIKRDDPSYTRMNLPVSRYLLKFLREPLREWLPEDTRYEDFFCRFEYLTSLVAAHFCQKEWGGEYYVTSGLYFARRTLPEHFQTEVDKSMERWPFLKDGLFGGSMVRLRETKSGFDQAILKWRHHLGFY